MTEYPKEFEKIWKNKTPSRLSGRKEAGFAVYNRMKRQLEKAEKILRSLCGCVVNNHTGDKVICSICEYFEEKQ